MKERIIAFNNQTKENLDLINRHCTERTFQFNTSELIPFTGKGTETACPVRQQLGWQFGQIQSPVVYWFTMDAAANASDVFAAAKACKASQDRTDKSFRHLPAMQDLCPSPFANIICWLLRQHKVH